MELAWSLTGFETLTKQANEFVNELSSFTLDMCNGQRGKVQKSLISFKSRVLEYLHGLCTKKRTSASHLLVFMVSDELRNRKPYAVPVQFMPYCSLTDSKLRDLEYQLECAMRKVGMPVVGKLFYFKTRHVH